MKQTMKSTRKSTLKPLAWLLAALLGSGAQAQAPDRPAGDLPAPGLALALIDADPAVGQALHALQAARHGGAALAVGPHEWTANGTAQRRRYQSGAPAAGEWSAGVQRTLRMPGKARLDAQLGDAHVQVALAQLRQARLQTASQLLELWLDWVGAEHAQALWQEQRALARANLDAAGKRLRAGDASRMEENTVRADVLEVERQMADAASTAAMARARLATRFAQLPLQLPGLADPVPLADGDALGEAIVHSHAELAVLREQLAEAELTGRRAEAERTPDPTLGLAMSSEGRGGAERTLGVTLSIPLGGSYRAARAQEALQLAEAARLALESRQREVRSLIAQGLADASGSLQRWQLARQSRQLSHDNAQLSQRAYRLGESDLQSLLLARRQSGEAAIAELRARSDAVRAGLRLRLQANRIWNLQE